MKFKGKIIMRKGGKYVAADNINNYMGIKLRAFYRKTW